MRYPAATWRGPIPASNYRAGAMGAIRGVTIHHMDGSLASTDGVFRTPGLGRSAHFGTGRDGTVYQWVDTDDVAYHACNANWTGYIGIENDDSGQDLPLTDAQITALRALIDWLGIDKKLMAAMTDTGVGYHGQFPGDCATHWGQTACPGVMVDQLPLLIADAPVHVDTASTSGGPTPMKLTPYGSSYLQYGVDTTGMLLQSTYDKDLKLVEQDKKLLAANRPSSDVEVLVLADGRILIGTEDTAGHNRAISYRPGSGYFDARGGALALP
jgi:hypothetical protein